MSSYLLRDPVRRCERCGGIEGATARHTLTRKQYALYVFLSDYIEQHRYAPSFDEIAERFGYRSLATVHEHMANLERKGWIRRRYNEARAVECLVPLHAVAEVSA